MIVGPKKMLFMDEISTGLDSSTTFQIMKCLRDFAHLRMGTVFISLLQPPPEVYNLFDDIMLLSEGMSCSFNTALVHQSSFLVCVPVTELSPCVSASSKLHAVHGVCHKACQHVKGLMHVLEPVSDVAAYMLTS